jgi:hypothetical protein
VTTCRLRLATRDAGRKGSPSQNRDDQPIQLPTASLHRFVLSQYVQVGVEELDREKLPPLLRLKYNNAISDAVTDLGRPEEIGVLFSGFQKYLHQPVAHVL